MKIITRAILFSAHLLCCLSGLTIANEATVTVKMDEMLHQRPVSLIGGNTEDLNYQLYGGLYSQLLHGEAFEEEIGVDFLGLSDQEKLQVYVRRDDTNEPFLWLFNGRGYPVVGDITEQVDDSIQQTRRKQTTVNLGSLVFDKKPYLTAEQLPGDLGKQLLDRFTGPEQISRQWNKVQSESAQGSFTLVRNGQFTGEQAQRITFVNGSGEWGIDNAGLHRWGIKLEGGKPYEGTLRVKSDERQSLFVSLRDADGKVLGEREVALKAEPGKYQRVEFNLVPNAGTADGRFTLVLRKPGTITVDYAFLQAGSWGRLQELPVRLEMAEAMKSMTMATIRYNGSMVNRSPDGHLYKWKEMIGPPDERQPYHGWFNPYASHGFTFFEFMDLCEILGIDCMFGIRIDETEQDVRELIEYCLGSEDTPWGRKRIELGHPKPYRLQMIQIGNEEAANSNYAQRVKALAGAIWDKNSNMQVALSLNVRAWEPGGERAKCLLDIARFVHELGQEKQLVLDSHYHSVVSHADTGLANFVGIDMHDYLAEQIPGFHLRLWPMEENGSRCDWDRGLAHAHNLNTFNRLPLCVERTGTANIFQAWNKNLVWNQGRIHFTPDQIFYQPSYYVDRMFGVEWLPVVLNAKSSEPLLDVTAKTNSKGDVLTLYLANIGAEAVDATLDIEGFTPTGVEVTRIGSPDLEAANTPENPDLIVPVTLDWDPASGKMQIPGYSFTTVRYAGSATNGFDLEKLQKPDQTQLVKAIVKQSRDAAASQVAGVGQASAAWSFDGDVLRQSNASRPDLTHVFGDPAWKNIDYSLQARKIRGSEGFLILFGDNGMTGQLWLNLGGWKNVRHGIEDMRGGRKRAVGGREDGSIDVGRWYDIRVRTEGRRIQAWLDGRKLFDGTAPGAMAIAGRVGVGTWNTAAEFRNIQVKDLAGEILFEGLPKLGVTTKSKPEPSGPGTIVVHVDQPTVTLKEELYGVFYEDINYAADGGLYAELAENRSFEYEPLKDKQIRRELERGDFSSLFSWKTVQRGGGRCTVSVEDAEPLNDNNCHYAQVRIEQAGEGVGLANTGYDGIYVEKGKVYEFSVFAKRTTDVDKPLFISLRKSDGSVIAKAMVRRISKDWKKYEATLTSSETAEQATLEVVTTGGSGTLCLDMVSLFPRDTFMGRKNGLRKDLAQAVADLKPKLFRFPGGCVAHGQGLDNAYRWKDTVGPVETRKPNFNLWGYHQSYGLGYFEYFQFCEDIGAEPLPILAVGVSCGFRDPKQFAPIDQLQPWIDDAIDLVEFANGPIESKWGRLRAEMGHPEPFGLKYIGLGNEDHDTPEFRERFPYFVKALRAAHPEITIVGTSGLGTGVPLYDHMCEQRVELSDEHYYQAPKWFINNQHRFDDWDRSLVPVFVGEYASRGNAMLNAVSEAAYLTGIERNGDIVHMTAYAPLFARYGFTQWKTANLIWFDHKTVVKTPNYHVQQLFSLNKGDVYLKNEDQGLPEEIGIAASLDKSSGDILVKIANPLAATYSVSIRLVGAGLLGSSGTLTVLSGAAAAANSLETPDAVTPAVRTIKVGERFDYTIPPMSVQFLRIPTGEPVK
ncbi:alpha-L-arabinofuranosidase C-terminal domain-containing protein [Novipirellula artificiosorum]|uniref:non-reducing end alpha-L-arabinofuranosidase n=1 Tax=Novipirellula artificiosorum TaxID=2528016 RepID=A0A5C6DKY7_9BACT|nr:alpha-L-arabinofuranosidase C-terminal domain-containing protein [Novipirellula artificiosorum]TWU37438.1 Extracellular exo-alpha-L-arabinofuranosidase precursor [Novipirellula artificiosorum]